MILYATDSQKLAPPRPPAPTSSTAIPMSSKPPYIWPTIEPSAHPQAPTTCEKLTNVWSIAHFKNTASMISNVG